MTDDLPVATWVDMESNEAHLRMTIGQLYDAVGEEQAERMINDFIERATDP